MNFKQALLMAFKSLRSSKMRAFLTMLGIIIGVASVIILISLIGGMSKQITDEFQSLGTNLIEVYLWGRGDSNRFVTPEDMEKLQLENEELLAAVSPIVEVGAMVKYQTNNYDTGRCLGVSESYAETNNYTVSQGRFISYTDIYKRLKTCVLGSYPASTLFNGENPLGKEIKVNGELFTVVGVIKEKQASMQYGMDDVIFLPYTSAMRLKGSIWMDSYSFQAANEQIVNEAKALIEAELTEIYGNSDSFYVYSQAEMLEQLDEITGIMSLVLVGIAAISLLVGGIGIMNIMLVVVTERIREIGIRKSIGARRRDILSQFLIESATTSSIGGVIGIGVGIGASFLLGSLIGIPISPSLFSILLAFGVSFAIGLTFGFLPANKAAKLHPIDALRHE